MSAPSLPGLGELRAYARAWALSVSVHGLVVASALALLSDLKLVPEPEPFTWNVVMVETQAPKQIAPPESPPPQPAPAQPVPRTVQTVRQVVQQEIREVEQVVRTAVQTTQVVRQLLEAAQTVQETRSAPTETVTTAETRTVATRTPAAAPSAVAAAPTALVASASSVVERPTVEAVSTSSTVQEQTVATQEQAVATVEPVPSRELPVRATPAAKADYGWLAALLRDRVDHLKRYPYRARINRWEGRVVLRAVIKEDGHLVDLEVAQSSGHSVLDLDALEIMRQASPLKLDHPLGKPQVVVQVPISYRMQ